MGIYKNTKTKTKLRKKTKIKLNSISNLKSKFRNKPIVGGSVKSVKPNFQNYHGKPHNHSSNSGKHPVPETPIAKQLERASSGNIGKIVYSALIKAPIAESVGLGLGAASLGLRSVYGVGETLVDSPMAIYRGIKQRSAKHNLNEALGLKTKSGRFWKSPTNTTDIKTFRTASNTYIKEKEKDLKEISKLEGKTNASSILKLENLKKNRVIKNTNFKKQRNNIARTKGLTINVNATGKPIASVAQNFGSTVKDLRKALLDQKLAEQQKANNRFKEARAKYDNAIAAKDKLYSKVNNPDIIKADTGIIFKGLINNEIKNAVDKKKLYGIRPSDANVTKAQTNINKAKKELETAKNYFTSTNGKKTQNIIAHSKHLNKRKKKFEKTMNRLKSIQTVTGSIANAKEAAKISFETQKTNFNNESGIAKTLFIEPVTSAFKALYGVTLGKLIKSKPSTLELAESYDIDSKQIAFIKEKAETNKKEYNSLKASFEHDLYIGKVNKELSDIYTKIYNIDKEKKKLEKSIKDLKQKINDDPIKKSLYEAQLLQEERNLNKLENDIGRLEDIDYNLKISKDAPFKKSLVELFDRYKNIASQKQQIRKIDTIIEQKKLLLEEKVKRDIAKINTIGENDILMQKIEKLVYSDNNINTVVLNDRLTSTSKADSVSKVIQDDKQYQEIFERKNKLKENWKANKKNGLSFDEYNKILDYVEAQLNLYIQSKVGIYGQSQI